MKPRKTLYWFRLPRADAKLANLPEDQRRQLIEWLTRDHLKYKQVIQRLQERFRVKTSLGALSGFYNRFCTEKGKQHDFSGQAQRYKPTRRDERPASGVTSAAPSAPRLPRP